MSQQNQGNGPQLPGGMSVGQNPTPPTLQSSAAITTSNRALWAKVTIVGATIVGFATFGIIERNTEAAPAAGNPNALLVEEQQAAVAAETASPGGGMNVAGGPEMVAQESTSPSTASSMAMDAALSAADQKTLDQQREELAALERKASEQYGQRNPKGKRYVAPQSAPAPKKAKYAGIDEELEREKYLAQKRAELAAFGGDSAVDGGGSEIKSGGSGNAYRTDPAYASNGRGGAKDGGGAGYEKQGGHDAFLADARGDQGDEYLGTRKNAAKSPYQIHTGEFIPAVMKSGINSDLPGKMVAVISENIYDSNHGDNMDYCLIPQGTKIVGRYEAGQTGDGERVLIVWDLLEFPDGSTMRLMGMQGYDQGGFSGLKDLVDRHMKQNLGTALLVSLISGGLNVAASEAARNNPGAAAVGQGVENSMQEVAKQWLVKRAPTIVIRPGQRVNVMVERHLTFDVDYGC